MWASFSLRVVRNVGRIYRFRNPTIPMEHASDADQALYKVRAPQRYVEPNDGTVAIPDQRSSAADDLPDEVDGVFRHEGVGNRPFDVGRVTVTAPLRRERPETLRECRDALREGTRIDADSSWMEQHERLAVAALVIPGAHPLKFYVCWHLSAPNTRRRYSSFSPTWV